MDSFSSNADDDVAPGKFGVGTNGFVDIVVIQWDDENRNDWEIAGQRKRKGS